MFTVLQWLTRGRLGVDWSAIRMRKEATWAPQWMIWTAILGIVTQVLFLWNRGLSRFSSYRVFFLRT
ncbi:hypothetical protein [Thalassoglobus polymorphus]|uniref:hypothetical protein n=1 Tax=Thalassoglobus polymorphus TaxID=2527994 RepID=UPI0018D23E12|nr:hypothetical protein [Thalassoglobus polymorphus]